MANLEKNVKFMRASAGMTLFGFRVDRHIKGARMDLVEAPTANQWINGSASGSAKSLSASSVTL